MHDLYLVGIQPNTFDLQLPDTGMTELVDNYHGEDDRGECCQQLVLVCAAKNGQ